LGCSQPLGLAFGWEAMISFLSLKPMVMDGAICVPPERNSSYWFKTWEQGFYCWKAEEGGRTYPIVFPYRMVDEKNPDCLHEDLDLLFSVAHGLGMTQPEPGHYLGQSHIKES